MAALGGGARVFDRPAETSRMNAPARREGLPEGLNLHENRLRTERGAVKRGALFRMPRTPIRPRSWLASWAKPKRPSPRGAAVPLTCLKGISPKQRELGVLRRFHQIAARDP
jgi:hypothetical protein